jgi:hypothetical protein
MSSWNKEIRAARSWQELLALARDFVAKLTPAEVVTLPPTCREIRIKGTDDLHFWHERLAEEFFARAARGNPTDAHRDLLDFFTIAAERATELVGTAGEGETAPNDGFTAAPAARGGKRVLH